MKIIIRDDHADQWLLLENPVEIIRADELNQVLPALQSIESKSGGRYMAAGFLSYEAAAAFDSHFQTNPSGDFPLLYFALFKDSTTFEFPRSVEDLESIDWQPVLSEVEYLQNVKQIKNQLLAGNTYQVNYTFRLRAKMSLDPYQLFLHLAASGQARYGAYIDADYFAVCCASPELFFTTTNRQVHCRPMKGTAKRGLTAREDQQQAELLRQSEKERAENVMIVDMIRNDLSHVCDYGSVNVPKLFAVEKYPTLWQMVTEVTGRTDASISQIMGALFPCASITGAPKINTMSIIRKLEKTPRNIYTGTIGLIHPEGRAQFNVAIRTVLADKKRRNLEYGVGSGIVWDSEARREYQECLLKAQVLTAGEPEFDLLETMRVDRSGEIYLLEQHLKRLSGSANYFDYVYDEELIRQKLAEALDGEPSRPLVLRLLLSRNGKVEIQSRSLPEIDVMTPVKLKRALKPIDRNYKYFYHKTTNRKAYEQFYRQIDDADDVILWNEAGCLTETTIANIIVNYRGRWITPPVSCGLLDGVYRRYLVDKGVISEEVLTFDLLKECEQIFVINSVRKWRRAVWMTAEEN